MGSPEQFPGQNLFSKLKTLTTETATNFREDTIKLRFERYMRRIGWETMKKNDRHQQIRNIFNKYLTEAQTPTGRYRHIPTLNMEGEYQTDSIFDASGNLIAQRTTNVFAIPPDVPEVDYRVKIESKGIWRDITLRLLDFPMVAGERQPSILEAGIEHRLEEFNALASDDPKRSGFLDD